MKIFDKDTSIAIKGIAILMMLFHHLYHNGLQTYQQYNISYFPIPEINVHNIATVFKICVSLYAFISGYGLYENYKKGTQNAGRWVLHREIKLLTPYWFIVVLCWMICQITDGRTQAIYFSEGDAYTGAAYMLIDFLGGATLFGTPTLILEWWYMSAAVVYVFLIPFVVSLEDKLIPLLLVIVALPRVLGFGFQGGCGIYSFLLAFLLGVSCAKYNLVNRWINFKIPIWAGILKFILEFAGILLGYKFYRNISVNLFWEFHYGLYPLLVIFFCVDFIVFIPLVRESLVFLGKHSTNMYLIHSLFLYIYLPNFIYDMTHFLISFIVLTGFSLGGSILIEWIKRRVRCIISLIYRKTVGFNDNQACP